MGSLQNECKLLILRVVRISNGQINSLVRSADGGIMSNRLPLSWNRNVKKISWKEIVR